MQHSSIAKTIDKGFKESNERLEYLGDALLGAIVAEYLFARFPYKEEGFLTEIRSRIVNREVLNNLAKKIGIKKLVGFLFRGGFEMRKLRVGLEYTFLPEADITLPGEETVGTLRSSFLGLSVGLMIGGGKLPESGL